MMMGHLSVLIKINPAFFKYIFAIIKCVTFEILFLHNFYIEFWIIQKIHILSQLY
jgi:hypothetical protein